MACWSMLLASDGGCSCKDEIGVFGKRFGSHTTTLYSKQASQPFSLASLSDSWNPRGRVQYDLRENEKSYSTMPTIA